MPVDDRNFGRNAPIRLRHQMSVRRMVLYTALGILLTCLVLYGVTPLMLKTIPGLLPP
jgi:hypothetical protein